MPSLLPDFEYDIFISYRHNDNRSGWVTEFVNALQQELAATIKEPISIYFDKNPHDGLGETHNVDKSLEGKLKCLIFIPIISQTYCDPKSFAWQHEFCAFNKFTTEDQFGTDIKLANGNVASRILPIKIHDLDADDKAVIEGEIGGVLRAIDFIYREPGVNRPLKPADPKGDNQNKTDYGNQVNKAANSVKEIINAMKKPVDPSAIKATTIRTSRNRRPLIAVVSFTFLVILAAYFLYPYLVTTTKAEVVLDKSIAVLPFVNMSNDKDQEYFSDGISEEILNLLAKVPELKVIGRTSSFYFKGKNEDLRMIGEKLGAASILEGSVRKDGDRVRITAQLIRASDGVHLWSETYDRKLENIFALQDEIATAVLAQLKLKLFETSTLAAASSRDTAVYNLMLRGNYFVDQSKIPQANEAYVQALALDSSNARIWSYLAFLRILEGNSNFAKFHSNYAEARLMAERAMQLDNSSAEAHRVKGLLHMWWDFDWVNAEKEFNLAIKLKPRYSDALRNLAQLHRVLGNYDQSYAAIQESLANNPLNITTVQGKADLLIDMGRYDEAIVVLNSAIEFNKDIVNGRLVITYLAAGRIESLESTFNKMPEATKSAFAPMVFFALGKKDRADQAVNDMLKVHQDKKLGSFDVALAYSFINQKKLALDYLEKAADEKYRAIFTKTHVFLKQLHDQPRYKEVLRRVNLPI